MADINDRCIIAPRVEMDRINASCGAEMQRSDTDMAECWALAFAFDGHHLGRICGRRVTSHCAVVRQSVNNKPI
jgi:hypothetical protein